MDVSHLAIDSYASVGKTLILVNVTPSYAYENGTRTDKLEGYRYEIVLPEKAYEKLSVRIPGEQRIEVSEGDTPFVSLDGLSLKLFWTPQGHKVSATADNIKLINPPKR